MNAREEIRNLLIERRVAFRAAESHRARLKQLEKRFPPGPRGGVEPFIKDARRLQRDFHQRGGGAFLDQMVDRFAYHAERWWRMADPAVTERRPYLRYVCACLPDSRPSHREKHSLIFPITHAFWSVWYPLNGFGCRCYVASASEVEMKREGWRVSDNHKFKFPLPDEGFDFNIGLVLSRR